MNKKIIAVAVAAGLALPMVSAHAVDVADKKLEVYGKLHMNLGTYDENGSANDNWRLSSVASRLGFKGKQKLDEGLTGTYKFEFQVDAADADAANKSGLERRNMYVGLKGGFGEVRIGRHDTPLKMSQGKFDQFGDTDGDLKNAGSQDGDNRLDNTITYLGSFGDIGFNAQIVPGEGDGVAKGNGLTDTTSIALTYKAGPLYLAVANDSHDKKVAAETGMTRLTATYKLNDMQFGLLSQSGVEKPTTSDKKETWLGLSFNMKMGSKNKFKAQYITVKDNAATVTTTNQMTVGFDHKLGKKGTVYAMYNSVDATGTASDSSSLSAGYILKF